MKEERCEWSNEQQAQSRTLVEYETMHTYQIMEKVETNQLKFNTAKTEIKVNGKLKIQEALKQNFKRASHIYFDNYHSYIGKVLQIYF